MTSFKTRLLIRTFVFPGLLLLPFLSVPAQPQSTTPPATQPAASAVRYQPTRFSKRADLHYSLVWGVDSLSVKWAESGELIRFSWRVLDPNKAAPINDKQSEPQLMDPQAGVSLVIPSLEKVGKLRQSSTPIAGRSYWMAFSNKGRRVKRGDRVSVVIGKFRADNLVVD
jgi:hypothetical protein